ncbi:MAG: hypothetical protein LBS85_08200 [Clostridiales Family XIII bacterium]|jgi:hypothetical protein|nr:hypothetical protein [Clostridiales Family XIII bacterium]
MIDIKSMQPQSRDILLKQKPMNVEIITRVKKNLRRKGVVLEQSQELDIWLESIGCEGITMPGDPEVDALPTIVMHTGISASGFFEELIHLGQIQNYGIKGTTAMSNVERLGYEIQAKEKVLAHINAYGVTRYEKKILIRLLNRDRINLEKAIAEDT